MNSTPSRPNNPNSEKQSQTTLEIQLEILPDSFKTELFEKNLAFFKVNQSSIYNEVVNHKAEKYRLCLNPDGSLNIYVCDANKPLYPFFSHQELKQFIEDEVNKISLTMSIDHTFLPDAPEWWIKNNQIQYTLFKDLYDTGPFSDLNVMNSDLTSLNSYSTDYFPLVKVFGLGLGHHIVELIQSKNISLMTIYEPELDLFYATLFVVPWEIVFKYFELPNKRLNLVIGTGPEEALEKNISFYRQNFLPIISSTYNYKHISSEKINNIAKEEPHALAVLKEIFDAGWYEDQRSGLYFSGRNIRAKNKVLTSSKVKKGFRAFVIGSGPSLTEALEYIKQHDQDALIFSCGTAISPLLNADIVPDFEIVQERTWHVFDYEADLDAEILKKIALIKLNVVSPQLDHYYKDTYVVQKSNDPGSSLLDQRYAVTNAVNPTVTNAGISIVAALGATEVFLFGVDYGAPIDSDRMHASNTIYDSKDDTVESKTEFELPGNLGKTILTDRVLSWSHKTSEIAISTYPEIAWYNVGEGARIKGTNPMEIKDLPSDFEQDFDKEETYHQITESFNDNYSPDAVLGNLRGEKMDQVKNYFEAVLEFNHSTPKTREEILGVLSLLYRAIRTGVEDSYFLPTTLLSTGLTKFVSDFYIQLSLVKDDESAVAFFKEAMTIFTSYIVNISEDLNIILDYIEQDEETELFVVYE